MLEKRPPYVCAFFLNSEVICSRSAARSAGFAESSIVPLTDVRAKQQPVGVAMLDLRAADLPAASAEAASVGHQVSAILDLIVTSLLPSGRVAAHLEEIHLLHGGGGHFVLLGGHVL